MPRRKPGALLPLEVEILEAAFALSRTNQRSFHGFGLARMLREQTGARTLTGHGTLYKALGRLEEFGLLASRWEDVTHVQGRPPRRLYELTGAGVRAVEQARSSRSAGRPTRGAPEPA